MTWTCASGRRVFRTPFGNEGNFYDVNHNPFVYFDDVTGNLNPSAPRCLQHVRPYSEFLTDLVNNTVPRYNFIVPDLCHDMHENISCSQSDSVLLGEPVARREDEAGI